jgi:hypothetical protein
MGVIGVLTISSDVWDRLTVENCRAREAGWAQLGVFGTGIGPEYRPGAPDSLLYVGKSAGPLGSLVGSVGDQALSSRASTEWMISRRNKSAFWQMVERFDPTRRNIAWTNLCKMDRTGGQQPPTSSEWRQIRDVCLQALKDEFLSLRPRVTLCVTSEYLRQDIRAVLSTLGFAPKAIDFDDGWTSVFARADGQVAVLTKHPQGWPSEERDRVVAYVRGVLSTPVPSRGI